MQCRFADQAESTKPLDAETQASGLQFREGSRFKDLAESLRLQLPETPVSQKPPATGTKVHSKLGLEGTVLVVTSTYQLHNCRLSRSNEA